MADRMVIRTDAPIPVRRPTREVLRVPPRFLGLGFAGWSLVAAVIIGAASWVFILFDGQSGSIFTSTSWHRLTDFFSRLAGSGTDRSAAFLDAGKWWTIAGLTIDSLAISLIAVVLAGLGAVATMSAAASNITHGGLASGNRGLGRAVYLVTRATHVVTRSIPEVVWALLIVFVIAPGAYAAAIALAAHNFGVLGRLGAELVENLDPRPLKALRSSGANNFKLLLPVGVDL